MADNKILKITLDTDEISRQFREFQTEVRSDLERGIKGLAASTHAKVVEMASRELNSSRQTFMDNLGFEEVAPGLWVVSVDEKGIWVEEGIEQNHDMKADLLKNASKTSKDGYKYRAIPFQHSKATGQLDTYSQGLQAKIKGELRKRDIPYKKIEYNKDGSPRLGKLHTINLQAGKAKPNWSTDPLSGINIYQSKTKSGSVRRDVLTFRTVSENPAQKDKWIHPGYEGKKFLDRAYDWALNEWESKVLPEVLEKWKK